MSYWWFWSRYRSENILTTFWTIGLFPVGVTKRSSGGQNFKMLQMTFLVHQITREVMWNTKIYSLLCVVCMVREILTKGHPKVKWGQIFNNIWFTWMIYQIIPLSLHTPKIYTLRGYCTSGPYFWRLCVFSHKKKKATLDKVSYGSGQK